METKDVTQCKCITEIEEKLPDHCLNVAMFSNRAIIALIRRDKWVHEKRSGKPSSFLASYCPFCGTKYKEP